MGTLKERRDTNIKKNVEEKLKIVIKRVEENLIRYEGIYMEEFHRDEESQLLKKELIEHFSSMEGVYIKKGYSEDWKGDMMDSVTFSLKEFQDEGNNNWKIALGVILILCLMVLMIVG